MTQVNEAAVRAIGEQILKLTEGQSASIFKRDYWNGQIMDWSMTMPEFKVEMFRFVDVLPVLHDSTEVARHIQEYFCRPDQDFPKALQWGLKSLSPGSVVARLAAGQIERNVVGMAKTFIAGTDAKDALPKLKAMWKKQGIAFTVDLLGEATVSEAEAAEYQRRYLDLIENMAAEAAKWPAREALESDAFGPMPRVNVSIKLSALYPLIETAATEQLVPELKRRLRPLFKRASELGVFVNLDMEHHELKNLTLALFKDLMAEPGFEGLMAGCVIQAYLRDSEEDLLGLIDWARRHERSVTVRLVKGAYWDYESIHAEQQGWPVPVWTDKGATDAHYERLSRIMLENIDVIRPAFGSHNVRSLAYAIATAQALGLPDNAYEIQMLYGMAEPLKAAIGEMGLRLRDYVPVGELIPGMAYLVRRLLENTSNESWLRARFAEGADVDRLLAPPRPASGPQVSFTGYPAEGRPRAEPEGAFHGEAPADFSELEARQAMRRALKVVEGDFGRRWPLVIGDEERWTDRLLDSIDPAHPERVVAQVAVASRQDIDDALKAARAAFPKWRDAPVEERAAVLRRAAALMRERRFNLAALMVHEAGKQWREADGDVCEAIDFLEYYARQAVALQGAPRAMGRVPGEMNHVVYEPRGMAAIIAPWNFPLAILVGMSSAALVTGNCALIKPAEQTPAVAAAWMAILRKAGLPPGVASFVPGYGEEVGAHLVDHPHVDVIAFTGSMQVGLSIVRQAAVVHPGQRNIKKVIAELGGKNAILVDSDADLDLAVQATLKSAFGFQGQKCSACSRAVVLAHHYDTFLERLVEATRSLQLGPAADPRFHLGPVIDAEAQTRLKDAIAAGRHTATVAVERQPPPGEGFYVGPTIFTDVAPNDPLAQQELFGPVLSVLKARDFDHALSLVMNTPFALTAGLISRSPLNIERARRQLRVGNLYINRGITGALVGRQPFGGFAMSGAGTKAGGPDYLREFVHARTITENTVRRGFAPIDEGAP